MTEIETVLSVEDCYDIIEVVTIDAYNSRVIEAANRRA